MRDRKFLRPKILFVDDEPAILEAIRRKLSEREPDWHLSFFSDPRQARGEALSQAFDVIVSDLRMPGIGGLDLLGDLRRCGVTAEAIILSGTGDMALALEAINKINVFKYFTKPCSIDDLVVGIRDALEKRRSSNIKIDVIESIPFAVVCVDSNFRILFSNSFANQVLRKNDVFLIDGSGICRAVTPEQTRVLHGFISSSIENGTQEFLSLKNNDEEHKYTVFVERYMAEGSESVALLFLFDVDEWKAPSSDVLKTIFSLANPEAKLAHALASGMDIREAATAMGVTVHTARTYLKALFEKTYTNRQADLVRVLLTSVPPRSSK